MKRSSLQIKTRNMILGLVMLTMGSMTMSFSGCSKLKGVAGEKEVAVATEAPEWVKARPHNGAYYIGIGTCSKTSQPLDYQAIAKKNALNDLASEISVRVQGQTFLNVLETNKNFSEAFNSMITTSTDEKIEDYEVAGIWENKGEYWVYYRLNKAQYNSAKQQKKNAALNQGYDYFVKGKDAEGLANVPAAFEFYMRGLFAIREYWNDVNAYTTESGNIYLDAELLGGMQRIASGLSLKPNAQKVVLSAENNYVAQVLTTLEYENKPVRGITVTSNYMKPRYSKPKAAITDGAGQFSVMVSDVSTMEKANKLDLMIDLQPLIVPDLDYNIQKGIVKGLRTEMKQVPIELLTPSFRIISNEKSYGVQANSSVLASAMSTKLVQEGMRISNSEKESNYLIEITSNTIDGGSAQGFVAAYLEMTVVVKNNVNGEVVYQESLNNIKGLQLNKDAAGVEAYKKGKEKIDTEIVKTMLEAIL